MLNLINRTLITDILTLSRPEAARRFTGFESPGATEFGFIANADGNPRWFYPKAQRNPLFLELYPTASLKASIFKRGVQAAYKLGLGNKVAHGSFSFSGEENLLGQLVEELGHELPNAHALDQALSVAFDY